MDLPDPPGTAHIRSPPCAQHRLLLECSTEANRIIDDVDLLDQLNETLDQASQINERRNRFCRDLLLPAMGGGPGWNRSRWQKDGRGLPAHIKYLAIGTSAP
jgi:hypothetical protein